MKTVSNTYTQKINSSAATAPLVVATVDKCLAPCEKCVGFYVDLTGSYRVDCSCKHHQTKEEVQQ